MTESGWLSLAVLLFGGLITLYQIRRSIVLRKGFSPFTMKMYVLLGIAPLVAVLAITKAISSDATVGLLGAMIGFAVGAGTSKANAKDTE